MYRKRIVIKNLQRAWKCNIRFGRETEKSQEQSLDLKYNYAKDNEIMTGLEREVQTFPEVHDFNVEGCSVFEINERITRKHKSLDNSVMRYSTY